MTKDVYHPLIRRGPETADLELYQWDGLYDRWDEQPSGFAPYELARLTKDSGGIYFVLPSEEFMRIRHREQAYSITQLKEYLPEYDNRLTYVREVATLRPCARRCTRSSLQGQNFLYRRDFPIEPRSDGPGGHARRGRRPASKLNALLEIQKRLETLKLARDREPEKRWQAHYDLMLAQTVAFQVKAYEYRALMASIVKNPPTPKGQPARRPGDHLGRRPRHASRWPPTTRPPRSTPRPSGCSRTSSPAIPGPPGPTWRRTRSTAASRSSSTSGTTTPTITTAPSSCPSTESIDRDGGPGDDRPTAAALAAGGARAWMRGPPTNSGCRRSS